MNRPERWGGRPIARQIDDAAPRHRVEVTGVVVTAVMARRWSMPAWTCRLHDDSGAITLVFSGAQPVPGIVPGACLHVEGTVLSDNGVLALWNPAYQFARPNTVAPGARRPPTTDHQEGWTPTPPPMAGDADTHSSIS